MNFSNDELLVQKKKYLKNFNHQLKFEVQFSFHDVSIHFKSDSRELISEIKKFIPASWKKYDTKASFTICHNSLPTSLAEWENEDSSEIFSDINIAVQRDFIANFNKETNTSQTIFLPKVCDGFYNFFRWFLSERLIQNQKTILHCSALLDEHKKTHIFLGPSGAGKTTITELSTPRTILGDDMNLVKITESNQIQCSPGAVGGLYWPQVDLDESFSIAGIYWITQSKSENKLLQISKTKQFQYLYSSIANIAWENTSEKFLTDSWNFTQKILDNFEIKNLHFKKDASFWKLLS
jgi:hypothetical protein